MNLFEIFRACAIREIRLAVIEAGTKLKYSADKPFEPEILDALRDHKFEIIAVIQRSQGLPACSHCQGQLFGIETIDGFENFECFHCGRCAGCRPLTSEAIRKYGASHE